MTTHRPTTTVHGYIAYNMQDNLLQVAVNVLVKQQYILLSNGRSQLAQQDNSM